MEQRTKEVEEKICDICGKETISVTFDNVKEDWGWGWNSDNVSYWRENWKFDNGKRVRSDEINISYGSKLKDFEMRYFPRYVCDKCAKKENYKELAWKDEIQNYLQREKDRMADVEILANKIESNVDANRTFQF